VSIHELVVVDMFCGAGGITTGLTQACTELGIRPKVIAINHWNVAIETHKRNHPEATHWCERVDSLDPRKLTPDGRIDFLIAAPEMYASQRSSGWETDKRPEPGKRVAGCPLCRSAEPTAHSSRKRPGIYQLGASVRE
jgi:hypothetical protein